MEKAQKAESGARGAGGCVWVWVQMEAKGAYGVKNGFA